MSERSGDSVWVSDLDSHISINHQDEYSDDEASIQDEFNSVGEIKLLNKKSISARDLLKKSISPSDWHHAVHKSRLIIGYDDLDFEGKINQHLLNDFLKGMLALGRRYAITRYAKSEHLDYATALTATYVHGIRALVNQFLSSEQIRRTTDVEAIVRIALDPDPTSRMTAYQKTGLMQLALHRIADEAPGHPGSEKLDRYRMRDLLSLTRLYFSSVELRDISLDHLRSIHETYSISRTFEKNECREHAPINGSHIRAWRLRHIRSLVYFYPYAIRFGLDRALAHNFNHVEVKTLVNELALAHCGVVRMRVAAKDKNAKTDLCI